MLTGSYIIDANFIIGLYQKRRHQGIEKLAEAVKQLKLKKKLMTSNVVFTELKIPRPALILLRDIFRSFPIRNEDINKLKRAKDPRKIPQDPDLSLVALAENIKNTQPKPIIIITNDFKLGQFIKKYTPSFSVLPPSSFLLSITNNLSEPGLKSYFKSVRKEITQYEFEYILQRRDIYNPREKLNWILEKAINVAQDSSLTSSSETESSPSSDGDWDEKTDFLNKLITGVQLNSKQKQIIRTFLPFTNSLIESKKSLTKILELNMSEINEIKQKLVRDYQLSQSSLNHDDKMLFQSIITKRIATFEFLTAIIMLETGDLDEAFSNFDYAAIYATLASMKHGDGTLVIKTLYLKALSYLHNDLVAQAEAEFEYTQKLAEAYKDNKYLIISMTGQAICKYLQGDSLGAKDIIKGVTELVKQDKLSTLFVLYELAENIYYNDQPEIAIHLYDEALEISTELGKKYLADKIKDRLKRSFYAVGQFISPEAASIDEIIDPLHEQTEDEKQIEQYNLLQAEIFSELNTKLNEKFPHVTKGKWIKAVALDKQLREPLDLLSADVRETHAVEIDMVLNLEQCGFPCFPEKAVKKGKGKKRKKKKKSKGKIVVDDLATTEVHPESIERETVFFTLSNKLGGIALKIPGEVKVKIPELYKVRIKPTAHVMIEESQQLDKDRYYMRAVVYVKSQDDLIVEKSFPEVYGIYFEN